MNHSPLERAIAAAGSAVELAKLAGVTPMAVSYWKVRGVPARHVVLIESATGVNRHELRPDLYPEAPPTLNQMMPQMPVTDQSGKPSVHSSSTAQASP
ncbi:MULTISPECIES: YdaS family helix-turn-helix protein [unclassified Pseudomonas]|uniref:transcriptional regulator n=1 Tax=unclassified Pseudomonas TaxID=196821 RepID=UPI0014752CA4|nr:MULTISPECIES: YdaS family helix-turn-helix protein [unclassified Pseudomonas]MBK3438784.1 helix-turn-helix domain-containing protein [Pseudomonas sp. MF7448]NMY23809.1 helix-turn-helix domain-containing protein [Pseudomonas sp. WS 5410]